MYQGTSIFLDDPILWTSLDDLQDVKYEQLIVAYPLHKSATFKVDEEAQDSYAVRYKLSLVKNATPHTLFVAHKTDQCHDRLKLCEIRLRLFSH